jgi:hypothetical protein
MNMGQETDISTLSGIGLAKYVLKRSDKYQNRIEQIATEFDNDIKFSEGIIYFHIRKQFV